MMSASNAALLYLLLIFTASFKSCYCIRNRNRNRSRSIFCPEIEKQSLLAFKNSLEDPIFLAPSWGGVEANCCKWTGVVCSNSTGHVTELHLDDDYHLMGKINPSIGNLSHLQTLVLGNNIGLSVDSLDWLSSLTKLEHLNLNEMYLQNAGNLAMVINSLPSLIELHLSNCILGPNLMAPPNDVNVNGSSLTFLEMFNSLQADSLRFLRWIFQFNELLYLDFSENEMEGEIPAVRNATKLQHIDLSLNYCTSSIPDSLYLCGDLESVNLKGNQLQGTISNAIANLTSLAYLDLSANNLSGKIPKEFGNLTSLNFADLSFNKISGKIPNEIAYLCKIKELQLEENELEGEIADSFGNMQGCIQGSLEVLSLNGNQLSGELPGEFKRLTSLDLSYNKLSGSIPGSIGKLSSLTTLWLNGNNFTGNLPESLGELFNLVNLEISYNNLEGVVSEANFKNLTNLKQFSASGNHLILKVSPDWIPPFQLEALSLDSWDLSSPSIPSWLDTQKLSILDLDLSNTGISGGVPEWIWGIRSLRLSHNHLHGQIPDLAVGIAYLNSNQFNGSLPRITGYMVEVLDLSNNSFSGSLSEYICDNTYDVPVLHLGKNQLSGSLPADCFSQSRYLNYLNIGDNNISGSIPNSIGFLESLASLNLYGNNFSGPIPSSLRNCKGLIKIDLAHNDLDGTMPSWIGEMDYLRILILQSNSFDGLIPPEICRLNNLQILDLSDNEFSGVIPACVHNLTAMAAKRSSSFDDDYIPWMKESASVTSKGFIMQYDTILSLVTNIDLSNNNLSGVIPKGFASLVELKSLNLSRNHLTGPIPEKIGDMKELESLDFSNNSLSGPIPSSLALITYLSYLNLSYNRLTGRIPQGTQLQIVNASAYIGNNLCGPPLTSNCSSNRGHEIPSRGKEDDDDEGKNKIEWIYVLVSLGYAVGFSAVCTALVLNKSWRVAYFGFVEEMWDKLYVYVYVKWSRITKPSI